MGLAASQARLLFITARKGDVEFQEMRVANQKIALARESSAASEKYSDSLNARKLTWAIDGSATGDNTVDLTYNLLMRPNSVADAGQYIYTNTSNGKVILDSEYASAIGKDTGNAGELQGIMSGAQFLQKLMGIDAETAAQYANAGNTTVTNYFTTNYNDTDIYEYMAENGTTFTDQWLVGDDKEMSSAPVTYTTNGKGSVFCFYDSDQKADTSSMQASVTAALKSVVQQVCSDSANALANTIELDPGYYAAALAEAKTKTLEFYDKQASSCQDNNGGRDNVGTITKTTGTNTVLNDRKGESEYYVDLDQMAATFLTYFDQACAAYLPKGTSSKSASSVGSTRTTRSGSGGTGSETALIGNGSTSGTDANQNGLADAYEASFYLNLYNAINGFGWQTNNDVQSQKYLQAQILYGNIDIKQMQADGSWSAISSGDPDCPLRNEADDEEIAKAEAEYDSTKAKIDAKEQKLDLDMKNLDTERSALDTEIDSVKKIIDTNIQRSFKMFQSA